MAPVGMNADPHGTRRHECRPTSPVGMNAGPHGTRRHECRPTSWGGSCGLQPPVGTRASPHWPSALMPTAPGEEGSALPLQVVGDVAPAAEGDDVEFATRCELSVAAASSQPAAALKRDMRRLTTRIGAGVNDGRIVQRLAGHRWSVEKCSAHVPCRGFETKTCGGKTVTSPANCEKHECTETCSNGPKSVAWC